MSVRRNDLHDRMGLYELPEEKGLWMVDSFNEQPTITLHNIVTGELKEIGMHSRENALCKFVRNIGAEEEVAKAIAADPQFKDVDLPVTSQALSDSEESQQIYDDMRNMTLDASELIAMVIDKCKPNKELKEQLTAWRDQVGELVEK